MSELRRITHKLNKAQNQQNINSFLIIRTLSQIGAFVDIDLICYGQRKEKKKQNGSSLDSHLENIQKQSNK